MGTFLGNKEKCETVHTESGQFLEVTKLSGLGEAGHLSLLNINAIAYDWGEFFFIAVC